MRWQTLLLFTTLLLPSCANHTMHQSTIEFLGFEGCPNTPQLRARLTEAAPNASITDVDLTKLSAGDFRLGWGAPTILVEGVDLFETPPAKEGSVSCRNWSSGLPTVAEIKLALENRL